MGSIAALSEDEFELVVLHLIEELELMQVKGELLVAVVVAAAAAEAVVVVLHDKGLIERHKDAAEAEAEKFGELDKKVEHKQPGYLKKCSRASE